MKSLTAEFCGARSIQRLPKCAAQYSVHLRLGELGSSVGTVPGVVVMRAIALTYLLVVMKGE